VSRGWHDPVHPAATLASQGRVETGSRPSFRGSTGRSWQRARSTPARRCRTVARPRSRWCAQEPTRHGSPCRSGEIDEKRDRGREQRTAMMLRMIVLVCVCISMVHSDQERAVASPLDGLERTTSARWRRASAPRRRVDHSFDFSGRWLDRPRRDAQPHDREDGEERMDQRGGRRVARSSAPRLPRAARAQGRACAHPDRRAEAARRRCELGRTADRRRADERLFVATPSVVGTYERTTISERTRWGSTLDAKGSPQIDARIRFAGERATPSSSFDLIRLHWDPITHRVECNDTL
jgi:hypothetical protein